MTDESRAAEDARILDLLKRGSVTLEVATEGTVGAWWWNQFGYRCYGIGRTAREALLAASGCGANAATAETSANEAAYYLALLGLADARYTTDPAYRAAVDAVLARTRVPVEFRPA